MKLRLVLALSLSVIYFSARSQTTSDFNVADDGWQLYNASNNSNAAVTYAATGGNPGGTISYTTTSTGPFYYYNAPAKFLGNVSSSYAQNLTFDVFVNLTGADNIYGDVMLLAPGLTFLYVMPSKPTVGSWTSYSIGLSEQTAGWHVSYVAGAAPTKDQWKQMLAGLTSLRIRAKYFNGAGTYTSDIDNVVLNYPALKTPPAVTSIAPLVGVPNLTTITIAGSGFNLTSSMNAVFFGGVKAGVVSASATKLTVTVPKGAQFGRITVTDLATGLSAQSSQNFSPQFNNNNDFGGRIIQNSFSPRVNIPLDATTTGASDFSAGDIDGDGWNDLIVGEAGITSLSVFRNLGAGGTITSGTFATKVSFPMIYGGSEHTVVADFDGDGKLDVIVSCSDGFTAHVAIFRNTSAPGAISFAPPAYEIASSYHDGYIHTADIDGDGRPDLLSTFSNSSGGASAYFTVFQNLSTPGNIDFAYFLDMDFGAGEQSGDISTGDLDNDGKIDVVYVAGFDSYFKVLKNTSSPGSFSFQPPFTMNAGGSAKNVAIADFDNDGKLDLAYSGYNTNAALINKNISTPGTLTAASFAPAVTLISSSGYIQEKMAVGDLNGDSKPDLVLGGSTDLTVFENNATTGVIDSKTFLTGVPYSGGTGTYHYFGGILLSDFDGDGKLEIVIRESTSGAAPLDLALYQNVSFPKPVITSESPASASAGTSVTLTGDLMKTGQTTSPVFIRQGTLLANSSTTSMTTTTATIPLSGKSDSWSITSHGLTSYSQVYPVSFSTTRVIDATALAAPVVFPLSSNVNNSVMIADLDDDGKVDVGVVDNYHTGKIFQNTHTTAGDPVTTASLTEITSTFHSNVSLAALDIDGDGKLDITSGYGIYQNASTPGTISFPTAPNGTNNSTNFSVAVAGDFNNDGKTDFAGISPSALLNVYQNNSTVGAFSSTSYFSSISTTAASLTRPGGSGAIASADFDNDGNLDLATSNSSTNNFSYFQNLGVKGMLVTASFATAANITTGVNPSGITASDFDGDGKTDIAIAHYGEIFVSVYRNTSTPGSITFAAPVNFPVVTKGYDLVSQDMDGDGKMELIIIHQNTPGSLTLLQNTCTPGTISFATAVNFPMTRKPLELGIADINQDNKPDVIVAADALLVFQNTIPAVLIKITQQPSDASPCQNATAVFTTTANGTTNIAYQWQRSAITPVSFSDLAEGDGFNGTATASLTVNTALVASPDQFRYRCKISGDATPAVFTGDAGLTIQPGPANAPGVSDAFVCSGATAVLKATGADDGLYRWYADAAGGTAINGQQNSSFTTPALTANATYYVSISNGVCETQRIAVAVTVKVCDTPPEIKPASVEVEIGGTATLSLLDLLIDPDNNVDSSSFKITLQPASGAKASIDAQHNLNVDYSGDKFAGIEPVIIQVCDKSDHCTTQRILVDVGGFLIVYNGISPDANGQNDKWIIQYIDTFSDSKINHVTVFNRWGDKVFDVDNYDNTTKVFTGASNSGADLPSGTYFYKIVFASDRKSMTGYLSLKR